MLYRLGQISNPVATVCMTIGDILYLAFQPSVKFPANHEFLAVTCCPVTPVKYLYLKWIIDFLSSLPFSLFLCVERGQPNTIIYLIISKTGLK